MNWDQQLIKACTETDGTPHPHTDHVLSGAQWQRNQLRTDESLELTARAILDAKYLTTWDKACAWEKDNAFHAARAAINALLGEEPCHR